MILGQFHKLSYTNKCDFPFFCDSASFDRTTVRSAQKGVKIHELKSTCLFSYIGDKLYSLLLISSVKGRSTENVPNQ